MQPDKNFRITIPEERVKEGLAMIQRMQRCWHHRAANDLMRRTCDDSKDATYSQQGYGSMMAGVKEALARIQRMQH